jgi:hypothetical protein
MRFVAGCVCARVCGKVRGGVLFYLGWLSKGKQSCWLEQPRSHWIRMTLSSIVKLTECEPNNTAATSN